MFQALKKSSPHRLFVIATLAIFSAAISMSLRVAISDSVREEYLTEIDPARSVTLMTEALGISFFGFALSLFFGSLLLDFFGIRRVLAFAGLAFATGACFVIFSGSLASGMGVFWLIWFGMLLQGIGWGSVEAASNPLIATIYPDDMIHRMNVLHAWWPAGIVVGGLWSVGAGLGNVDWRIVMAGVLIPSLTTTWLTLRSEFPKTARVTAGISFKDMVLEIFRRPSFFIWFGAMFLTAASELAPGQLVELVLTQTVGIRGIIILIYVSGMMFVFRHFAGSLSHRLSPVGLLWFSGLFAAVGLYLFSIATNPVLAILAATFWGAGVCFMWPTMVAQAAERYPNGGSWTIGLIGTAGALSIHFVLPVLGRIYDEAKLEAAGGEVAFAAASAADVDAALRIAAESTFQTMALVPAALLFVFGGVWLMERKK
ncbi:MAG: MFS transporter [Pseudomonadota bacterium]